MTAHYCLVCGARASASLGIRARWANTNAAWAPNLGIWLCDDHATSGCDIEISYRPTETGLVRVRTHLVAEHVVMSPHVIDDLSGTRSTAPRIARRG